MIVFELKTEQSSIVQQGLTPQIFQTAAIAVAKELQAEARPYPGEVAYPIEWKSEKQRRFYFAMRGKNLPYVRQSDDMSERLLESWAIEPYGKIGAVLKNNAIYAPFVIGDDQQPFHRNTGWRILREVAKEFFQSGRANAIYEKVIGQMLRRTSNE